MYDYLFGLIYGRDQLSCELLNNCLIFWREVDVWDYDCVNYSPDAYEGVKPLDDVNGLYESLSNCLRKCMTII